MRKTRPRLCSVFFLLSALVSSRNFSLSKEVNLKLEIPTKVIGDFSWIWRNFYSEDYFVKGLRGHEESTWREALKHCEKKGKKLFKPESWEIVEFVKELMARRKPPIPVPMTVWTDIDVDKWSFKYFLSDNKKWLNNIIENRSSLNMTVDGGAHYYVAIVYNVQNIKAIILPGNEKLKFFCESNLERTSTTPKIKERDTPRPPKQPILKYSTLTTISATELSTSYKTTPISTKDYSKPPLHSTATGDPSENTSEEDPTNKLPPTSEGRSETIENIFLSTRGVSYSTTESSQYTENLSVSTSVAKVTEETSEPPEETSHSTISTSNADEETSYSSPSLLMSTEESSEIIDALTHSTLDLSITKNASEPPHNATQSTRSFENTTVTNSSLSTDHMSEIPSSEVSQVTSSSHLTKHVSHSATDSSHTTEDMSEITSSGISQETSSPHLKEHSSHAATDSSHSTEQMSEITSSEVSRATSSSHSTESTSHVTDTSYSTQVVSEFTTETFMPTKEETTISSIDTSLLTKEMVQTTQMEQYTTDCNSKATENISTSNEGTFGSTEETPNSETNNQIIHNATSQATEEVNTSNSTPPTTIQVPISSCEARKISYGGMEFRLFETDFDEVAEPRCPRGTYGTVKWKCSRILKDFEEKPNITCRVLNCSDGMQKPTSRNDSEYTSYIVERLAKCSDDDDEKETFILFDKMKKARNKYHDAKNNVESKLTPKEVRRDMNVMLDVYDRLMDTDAVVWHKMKEKKRRETSMEIIKETEETAWTIGCLMKDGCMTKDNLAVEVFDLLKSGDLSTVDIRLALNSADVGSVRLPGGLHSRTSTCGGANARRGVVAAYKNTGHLNPGHNLTIGSGIIGVSVDRSSSTFHLPRDQEVRVLLRHPPKEADTTPLCVFLNWNNSGGEGTYGVWDTKGCRVNRSETNYTVCDCNHLTNFAILMDFTGGGYSQQDENALNVLSIICCSLSSIALLLTIIIYLTVKSLRSRRSTITCNLAACLLAMNLLVQSGLERATTTVCKVISGVLQYCVLSAFFWMLLEGALLYKMVIVVFETKKVSLKVLYAIAYGVPFFVVSLSSAVNSDTMIRDKHCWPSTERGHIWSVVGPIVLVITVNFIILCLTLNAALKMDKMNSTKNAPSPKDRKKVVKQRLKGVFSLLCLLGFTWTVGFFIVPHTPVAAYLFVIVNGLQGVFLFVSQLILNESARRKLFAIYKENFSRFSSVTSSWHLMSATKKNSPSEKPKPEKQQPKDEEGFSDICVEEEHNKNTLSRQDSNLQLSRIRLRIIELQKEQQNLHPFGLNHEYV